MPNIPQQQTIVQYITNVSQLTYTFAFYAPLPTDIQVYYQAANAQPIPATDILALNSQYTVTYNADPTTGGYITLLFTPTTGYYLTINRQVMASLNTNFSNAQNFNGANLDAALDRLLLLCQQNQNYNLQRNLSYIINTYLPNATPYTQLPPLPQNYIWIGSGAGVIAALVSTVPSASVLQSMLANNAPSTDGALLIGYYDSNRSLPTTVDAQLTYLFNFSNTFYGASVYLSGSENISAGQTVVIAFNTVLFDTNSLYNLSTYGFTIQKAGKYFFNAVVFATANSANNNPSSVVLYKNGTQLKIINIQNQSFASMAFSGSVYDQAQVGDFYQLFYGNGSGANTNQIPGTGINTEFSIQYVGQ